MNPKEKAFQTIREMLCDRKDSIISENDNLILTEKTLVTYNEESKITINHIKEFISQMIEKKYSNGIFIYTGIITSSAKKAIELVDKNIELFESKELQYNITKHRLVPKHTKLDGDELNKIKEKYGKQIPYIYHKDPVVRYYNFSKGDIIMIERKDSIIYRLVI